jgi:hypothetical protein
MRSANELSQQSSVRLALGAIPSAVSAVRSVKTA